MSIFLPFEAMLPGVPMVIVTSIGLIIGLRQYIKAQRWKRSEFIAIQIKEFENNPLVRTAMYMLDFRQGVFTVEGQEIAFDTDSLIAAIASHKIKPGYPNLKETQVRLAFCDFFEGIERFYHFVESKLISVKDIEPYLPYWIRRFTDPDPDHKGEDFIYSIWTFIDAYEYTGVRQLAEVVKKSDGNLKVPKREEAEEKTREWFNKKIGRKEVKGELSAKNGT